MQQVVQHASDSQGLLRGLQYEPPVREVDPEYQNFTQLGDYSNTPEVVEESGIPERWVLIIAIFCIGLGIMLIAFYVSYRQEWCCGVHQKEDDNVDEEKGKRKIPVKTFKGSSTKLMGDETMKDAVIEEGNENSGTINSGSAPLNSREMYAEGKGHLITESMTDIERRLTLAACVPRCVLCSKRYQSGEDVTHASNPKCHHEFHEECLLKHWKKVKKEDGKCPVCKETYVVAMRAPSKHFSQMSLQFAANKSMRASSNNPMAFDA